MSNARPNSNKRIILKIGTVPRRSLDSRWGLSLFFIRKLTAIITVISFITTSIPYDLALLRPSGFEGQAWAAENPSKLSGVSSDGNGGLGIILPAHLGQITDSYKGSSDKVVLHIQDAHCNYACQHKIAQIIEYFNSEYGADTINLEGGAKDYDLSIFTRIQDNSVREKTADYFVKEGLVNGAEYFAVNNPGKVALWGIEDTKLYINNLNAYRDSLKYKDEIEKDLKALNHILSNLKLKIYSPELLELDSKHNQYKTGSLDFKAYISYLISKNTYHLRGVTGLSNHSPEVNNLHLINQTLEEQDKIDFKKTNIERDILIDKLRKKLSKRSMEEFVLKIVEFKEERMSEKDFYSYLINKADLVGIDLKDYPELQRHIASLSVFGSVDKTKIMEEIEVLEHSIKEAVIARSEAARQSQCRQLDKLSTNLAIMKNIFNISLTKNEYKYFMANKDSFSAANYTSFINKTAPLYKITATLDDNITDLDRHLDNMLKFYEYSFKRDETFLKNLSMTKTDHLRGVTGLSNHSPEVGHGSSKPTILITGGFHTENLTTLLKKQNISYISIMPMPDFRDCESYERPYYRLLAGNISPIGKMLHTAIASSTLAIAALNNALGQEVWGQRNVDTYKAWVALRTILEEDITRITGITRKDKDNLEIAFDDGRTRLITINELFHETGEVIDRQMAEGKFFQISAQDPDRVKALELARRLGKEVEEGINNLANGIEREGHKLQIQEATNLPEGQNEHAGGWGISIRLGLQGDRRTEAILHGIIAGFVENHNNVDSITEALTRNDIKEAERLFKGAGKHQVDGRITALWDMSSTQREERAATRDFAKTRDLSKTRSEQESWKVVVPDGVISQEGPYITESPIRTSPVMKDKILGYEELSTKAKEFVYKNHGREKDIASMWELLKTTGRYVTDEEYEENVRKYIEQQTDRPGSGKAPAFVFRRQGDRNDRPIVMFKLCAGFDKYATANELEKEGERLRLQAGLDYVTDDQGRRLIVDLSTVESGNRMAYMPIEATRVMLPDGTIKVYWGYLGIEEIQEKIKGKIDLTLTRENFDDFVKYGSAWEFKGLGTYNYSSHLVTKSYMTKVNTDFLETLRGRVNNRENLMAYAWTKEERELIERLNEYACKLETKQLSKNVKYEDTPLVKIVNNILQQFDAQKYYIEEIHRPRAILPSLPGQKEGPTITRVTKYIGRRTIQLFIWSERAVIKDLIERPVYAHGACYQAISNEDLGGCLQRDEERAKDNQKILLAHGARLGSVIDDIIPTGITADDRSDGSQYAIIERLRTSGKNRMMPVDTYRIAMERLIDLKVELMDAKKQLQGDRKNTKLKQHIKKLEEDKDSLIQILTVCQWKIELLKMELGENFGMFFENMGVNTKAFISSEIMFNDELMAEGKDPTDWGDLNDPGEFWNFKNEAPQEIKKFSIIHIRKWLRLQSVFYEAVLAINSRKQPVWITDDDAIPDSFFSDNENLKIFLQGMFKGRLDQKDINGLKHYFAEDFKNDLKARMERMAPDRRTPSYRLIECYQLAAEVIYKYWAYGQQREKPATPESAKPAQLDKPRPGEGGTGFQDNIFEAIKTRLQRGGSTTLTVSEREVLLFGLEGPRYNEVAEVVRQLPEREKIALKADAANFVQPKGADPMSKTLDRALTDTVMLTPTMIDIQRWQKACAPGNAVRRTSLKLADPRRFYSVPDEIRVSTGKRETLARDGVRYVMLSCGACIGLIMHNKKTGVTHIVHYLNIPRQEADTLGSGLASIDEATADIDMFLGVLNKGEADDWVAIVTGGEIVKGASLDKIRRDMANKNLVVSYLMNKDVRNVEHIFPGQVDVGVVLRFDRQTASHEEVFDIENSADANNPLTINDYMAQLKSAAPEQVVTPGDRSGIATETGFRTSPKSTKWLVGGTGLLYILGLPLNISFLSMQLSPFLIISLLSALIMVPMIAFIHEYAHWAVYKLFGVRTNNIKIGLLGGRIMLNENDLNTLKATPDIAGTLAGPLANVIILSAFTVMNIYTGTPALTLISMIGMWVNIAAITAGSAKDYLYVIQLIIEIIKSGGIAQYNMLQTTRSVVENQDAMSPVATKPAQIPAAEPSATPVPSAASVSTADNTSITRRGFIKKAAVAAGAATVAGGGVALLMKGKNQPQEAEKITKTSDNELILPSDENTIKGIGKFLRTRFRNPGDIVGTITNWQVKESIELSNSRYKGLVKEIYDLLIAKGLWDKGKNRYPVLFLKGGMNGPAVGGIALIEHGIILINMEEPENALKVQLAELIAHEGQHLINHYEKQGISHLEDEYLAFWATWRATSILKREDKKAVEAASLVYRAFKVLVDNKDRVCRLMDVKPEDFKALQYSGYFIDESKDSKEKFIGINLYNSKTLEREPHTIFIDVGNRKIIEGGKPKSIDELSPEEHKKMEELIKKLNNLHATAYPVPSNFATDIITAGAMPATVPFAAKTTEHEVISTESRFSQKVVDKAVAAAMPAQIAAAAAGVAKIAVDKREALKSKLRPIGTIRSELIQERYSGLLAEIFDILPASVIEVINENFEEIDCNNDAISVGDGQYYEEGKTVKVGPCFDPLYFLKTALHEIAHSFEGQLQSYLKERGLWSTDSIDSVIIHEFTDALSMYILYPEEFRRFTVEGNAAKRWAAVYNFYKELFGGKEYMPQEISIIRDHINRLRELDSKDMMRYETIGLIKILVSNQRTAGETLPTVLLKNIEALLFPENEASSGIAATVVEKGAAAKPEQIAAPEPAAKAAAAVRKGDKRAQRFMRDYSWIFDRSGKFKYKDDEDIERLAKALSDFVKEQLPGAEFYNDTLPYRDAFKFIKDNFKDKRSARKAMQRLCEIYDKYSKLIAEVNRRYQKTFGIEGMGFGKIVFRCFRDDDPISVDAPSQNIDGLKNMKIQLDLASLLDKSNDFFGVGTIAHESGHSLKHFVASGFNAPRDLRAAFKRDLADEELLASWVAARICSNKELEGIVKDSARVWENIVKKDMGVSLASQLTVFAKICGASETGFGPTDANLLKTYKDYYGSLTLKGLAVPAGAMAPSAESRAYATEQTTEDRKDAMVKAFPDSRDNEVTVIMILPEGMSKNDIQPVQSAINGGLVKNRIGRMEDNRQVIIVTDGNIDKVKEQIRQIKDDRERRGAKGRFVIYAHKNESGSINVARSLQEYSQKESNVTVISDAYADFNPGENAYPDIMVRVVLGRDIAFYLDLKELNKDTSKVEVTINNLLENVAGGITLNDLLNMLKSLVLKRVNYSRDIGMWRKSQLEAATAI